MFIDQFSCVDLVGNNIRINCANATGVLGESIVRFALVISDGMAEAVIEMLRTQLERKRSRSGDTLEIDDPAKRQEGLSWPKGTH